MGHLRSEVGPLSPGMSSPKPGTGTHRLNKVTGLVWAFRPVVSLWAPFAKGPMGCGPSGPKACGALSRKCSLVTLSGSFRKQPTHGKAGYRTKGSLRTKNYFYPGMCLLRFKVISDREWPLKSERALSVLRWLLSGLGLAPIGFKRSKM